MKATAPILCFTIPLVLAVFGCGRAPMAGVATDDLDPQRLAYNLKTTLQAYEKAGHKNSKWNGDAKRCLNLFARMRSSTNWAVAESRDELRLVLGRLAAKNCDDPMVRYLSTRFVIGEQQSAVENADAYESVAAALQPSGYPEIRKFYATAWAYRLRREVNPNSAQLAQTLAAATEYLVKALADGSMPAREADDGCEFLMSSGPSENSTWDSYRALEPVLSAHWNDTSVANLVKGRAYLAYAWQARGHGLANTVTEEGWRLMSERLNVAAQALEAAWKLNPHDPRICREMMRVELVQSKGRENFETWFQRAMQLDPANYDVCVMKLQYLQPRWYGSVHEMLDFGRYCTTNQNWSGGVRLMLADAQTYAFNELQDETERAAYWKQPEVWADIHFAFAQFFKLYPQANDYRPRYALLAAQCGQWQEVKNQLKLFTFTNYAFFGGIERFNGMLQYLELQR